MSIGTVISYPIPAYANLPIESGFYQPSRFVISNIQTGSTTTVTTSTDHNYVVGQLVRLLIPSLYGASQLNNQTGFVISVPSTTQVVVNIFSIYANSFVANPLTASITGATNTLSCVLTANNSFRTGNTISISGVGGMTQLNGFSWTITKATPTTLTLDVDATHFGIYTSGGTATLLTFEKNVPQIVAIGDINSGQINANGSQSILTYVPGSFLNISPM